GEKHAELFERVRNLLHHRQWLRHVLEERNTNAMLEVLVPLCSAYLQGIGKPTVFVDDLRFNVDEDLYWSDVSAFRTSTLSLVGSVHDLTEVDDGFHRIAIVNLKAARVEDDECVEHLEDVGRRLVNHHEHHLSSQRQFLQQVHDVFRISR